MTRLKDERYELLELLGEGASGQVYRAIDRELQRTVIIKFLLISHHKHASKRFAAEALALSRLEHPNVVRLFEYEEDEAQPYIVLEDIDGRPLDDIIDEEERIAPLRATKIALDCVTGLEAAHKAGIIHRDIKPANIIITKSYEAKLIDFGLILDLKGEISTRMTEEGCVAGTLAYMAPEVLRGQDSTVTSDIYSLGVTLFNALTNHLPYEHIPLVGLVGAKANLKVIDDKWPPNVDDKLRTIVTSLVAARASERPKSALEVKRLLKRWINNSYSQSELPTKKRNLMELSAAIENTRQPKRNWWQFSTIVVLILFGTLFWVSGQNTVPKALTRAEKLKLEAEIEPLRQSLLSTPNSLSRRKLEKLAHRLNILDFKTRLGVLETANKEATTLLYLARCSTKQSLPIETTVTFYEELLTRYGFQCIKSKNTMVDREYISFLEKHDSLDRATQFFLKMAKVRVVSSLLNSCNGLAEAYLRMSDKGDYDSKSEAANKEVFKLLKFLLPSLKGEEFTNVFCRYVSLVSVHGGKESEGMLCYAASFLKRRPATLWRPRRFLAEALFFGFSPKPNTLKLAQEVFAQAQKGMPSQLKEEGKVFAAYLMAGLANSYHIGNSQKLAEQTILKAVVLVSKTKPNTNRAKTFSFLIFHRARMILGDNKISFELLRKKLKSIDVSTLKSDDKFWYELSRFAFTFHQKRYGRALEKVNRLVKTAPHRFRPSMLERATTVALMRGAHMFHREIKRFNGDK